MAELLDPTSLDLRDIAGLPLTPANGTVLQYNTTTGVWDEKALSALGLVLTDISDVNITVANLNSLDDGADSTLHFHASDRDRANHTGTQLHTTILDFDAGVQTNRLDQMAAPIASVDLNNQKIINLATPTLDFDASTKKYVDDSIAALSSPPFADTQTIIKGSADPTKLLRFEIDGFTTLMTRIITPPDADITLVNTSDGLIADANVASHTSTKITINNKGQLNSNIVYTDQANTFGAFAQRFPTNQLQLDNPAQTFQYIFATSAIVTSSKTVTLPLLTSNDTFVFESFAQTLANKTLTTPTIADFSNATHDHLDAAGGGQITKAAVSDFAHQASHQSGGGDALTGLLDATARTSVSKNSTADVGARRTLNFIEGSNITLTIADDAAGEEVDITITSTAGGGSPLTTKGDVYGFDTSDARIPVGSDNQVFMADSAQTLGVKYALIANANLASGVFGAITGVGTQSQALNMGGNNITDAGTVQADTIEVINAGAGTNPTLTSNSATNNLLLVNDQLAINNVGAGADPILLSNNAGQLLDLTGSLTISGTLVAGTYVGQSSITTLGTITSGVWNGTDIAFANIQQIATSRILGRVTAATGDIEELTGTQATTLLDVFTDALQGVVPASGGGTTNFLRADGTWAVPGGASSPLTTKGDIWGFSTVDARIPVGSDNQVFVADSAQTLGVKYALIINANVDAGAAIAYSKLNLTGSIVDADINASGITTRSKLPSAIAYEDEANIFTLDQEIGRSNATATLIFDANHTTAADGNVIGQIDFFDTTTVTPTEQLFGQIRTVIQDPANASYSAEMMFGVAENAGAIIDYIVLNEADGLDVTIKRDLDISSNTILTGTLELASGSGIGMASNQQGIWYDNTNTKMIQQVAIGDIFDFQVDATSVMTLDGNGIQFANGRTIEWGGSGDRRIYNDINGFEFEVETGDTFEFFINSISEMILSATSLDLQSNTITDVGQLNVNATGRIYVDGGGNTYLYEESADVISFIAGGVQSIKTNASGDLLLQNGDRLRLDGNFAGDTFIDHPSTDVMQLTVGNESGLYLDEDGTEVNVVPGAFNILATTATSGYFYIPYSSTGAFTGTPTAYTGKSALAYDQTNNNLMVYDVGESAWKSIGGGGGGHTIKEEGTPLTQRAGLNFVGAIVTATDDAGNDETDVTVGGTKANFDSALSDGTFAFLNQANVFTALQRIDLTDAQNNFILHRDQTTPADSVIVGVFAFNSDTDTTSDVTYGAIRTTTGDVTNATASGLLDLRVRDDNALTTYLTLDGELQQSNFATDVTIPATNKLFLDGGADTSIREGAANVITFETGGLDTFNFAGSGVAEIRLSGVGHYDTYRTDSTQTQISELAFYAQTLDATKTRYSLIAAFNDDNTNLSADGHLEFYNMVNGTITKHFEIGSTGVEVFNTDLIIPATNKLFLDGGSDTSLSESAADVGLFTVGGVQAMKWQETGTEVNVVIGKESALTLGATDGFLHLSTMAGTPTSAPPTTYTGKVPIVIDTANDLIYVFNSTWKAMGASGEVATWTTNHSMGSNNLVTAASQSTDRINLENGDAIGFENNAGTANLTLLLNSSDQFQFDSAVKIKTATTKGFNQERTDTITSGEIGVQGFQAPDGLSALMTYAWIKGTVESNTDGAEEGGLLFGVTEGGAASPTTYLRFNTSSNSRIDAFTDFVIPATNRIYFDGGGDTYLTEAAANVLRFVTGNGQRLDIQNTKLVSQEPIFMTEMAAAEANVATFGQWWVANDTPNNAMFTDDTGLDYRLSHKDTLEFVIDGGGSAITTGIKGDLEIPNDFVIERVTMLADQTGSIVVDIWQQTYASYPPLDANSITSSTPPTITSAIKSQDTSLTSWTTNLTGGSILRFNVDSASTITRVTISLLGRRV